MRDHEARRVQLLRAGQRQIVLDRRCLDGDPAAPGPMAIAAAFLDA